MRQLSKVYLLTVLACALQLCACEAPGWRSLPMLPSGGTDRDNCLVCHDNNGRGGSRGRHDFAPDRECLDCHLADDFEVVPHSGLRLTSDSCALCHLAPPDSGAHRRHVDARAARNMLYGSLETAASLNPDNAQTTYQFGCGYCHPLDTAKHLDGVVEVELYTAGAPGLKGLSPQARYTPATQSLYDDQGFAYSLGRCDNLYRHSDGRAAAELRRYASPNFGDHPSPAERCSICHDAPPRYVSGSRNGLDSNAHFLAAAWGDVNGVAQPGGHVSSLHWQHAERPDAQDSLIGCAVCHANTVHKDFAPSPELSASPCSDPVFACHDDGQNRLPVGGEIGDTRFHVNAQREVVFGTAPVRSSAQPADGALPPFVRQGDLDVADLSQTSYDATTRSCSNIACHLGQNASWGLAPGETFTCEACHVF